MTTHQKSEETKEKKAEKKRKAMKRKSVDSEVDTTRKKFAKVGQYWSDVDSPGSSRSTSSSPEVFPLNIHQNSWGSPLLSNVKDDVKPGVMNTSWESVTLDHSEMHEVTRFLQKHLGTSQKSGTQRVPISPGLLNFSTMGKTSAVDTPNSVDITNTLIDAVKVAESYNISHLLGGPIELKLVTQNSGTNHQQLSFVSNAHISTGNILVLIPHSSELEHSNESPDTVKKCKNGELWNFPCDPCMRTELSSSGAVPLENLNFPTLQQPAVSGSLESEITDIKMECENTVEYNSVPFTSTDEPNGNCDNSEVSEVTMVQSGLLENILDAGEGISDDGLLISEHSPLEKSLSREDSDISLHINMCTTLFPELLSLNALSEKADKFTSAQLPNDSSCSEHSSVSNICFSTVKKNSGCTADVTNKYTQPEITDKSLIVNDLWCSKRAETEGDFTSTGGQCSVTCQVDEINCKTVEAYENHRESKNKNNWHKMTGSSAGSVQNLKRYSEMNAMTTETKRNPSSVGKEALRQKVVYTSGDQAVPASASLPCALPESSSLENSFHQSSVYSSSSPYSPHLYPDFWETFGKFTCMEDGTVQYSKISLNQKIVSPTEHFPNNCISGARNPGPTTDGSSFPKIQDPDASFNNMSEEWCSEFGNISSPLEDPKSTAISDEKPGSADINSIVSREELAPVYSESTITPFKFKTLSFGDEYQELMNATGPEYICTFENQATSNIQFNQERTVPKSKMVFPQDEPEQQESFSSGFPDSIFPENCVLLHIEEVNSPQMDEYCCVVPVKKLNAG